jgi:hypothetical protein
MEEAAKGNVMKSARWNRILLGLIFVLAFSVLAMKAVLEGWFAPHFTLDLHQQPAVLFFNRTKGCDCAKQVYQAAARQMQDWPEANRLGVQVIEINLDRWPEAGEQFAIVRAPTLLLLDAAGNSVYRQEEVVTDLAPLNLPALEHKIWEVVDGK